MFYVEGIKHDFDDFVDGKQGLSEQSVGTSDGHKL